MSKLIVMRGLPGSGKSTWATKYREENPKTVIVEADLLRRMFYGKQFSYTFEELVHSAAFKCTILALEAGCNVILDECNIETFDMWKHICHNRGYHYELKDLTHVDIEECVRRDALRPEGKRVGREVIERMANRKPTV